MNKRGFTLIELLAVMAVIMILASIVVTSYFGMTRGAAMRSAVGHLQQTLNLARQMAIMHAKPTHVFFGQDETNAWYTVCMQDSRCTDDGKGGPGSSGSVLYDRFANFGSDVANATIYDLNTGASYQVVRKDQHQLQTFNENGSPAGNWAPMVPYGWEVAPRRQLPRGYFFDLDEPPELPEDVLYDSRGMTDISPVEINIYEKINPSSPARVTVEALTGRVVTEFP